ncbi:hypothetical protein J1N35_013790 [Gossypium stocksii]|uniref:Reverse transcriptase zinc-binding domain-containing protein n=1 Tax=Gossypium stocksii TaxID=47602 RepID=A0A9D3VVS4_9ROSI|nr:hypothetical protein J1N35_013790 [Gossypium stocksii]
MWKSIAKFWPLLKDNLIWSIGDDTNISYWEDAWVPNMGSLINHVSAHANVVSNYKLNEMILKDGSWNLDLFRVWLLEEIIHPILSVPSFLSSTRSDLIIYAYSTSDGEVTTNTEEGMQNISIKEREGLELVFEFDIMVSDDIDYDKLPRYGVQNMSKVDDLENRCMDMEVVKKLPREMLTNMLVPCSGPVGEQ